VDLGSVLKPVRRGEARSWSSVLTARRARRLIIGASGRLGGQSA
jgi:hypothetical protein